MESETLGSNGSDADNAVEVREGVKSPSPVNLSDENENDSENNEKPKKKSIIVWQCLNPECTNTNKTMLRTASSYALSYYGMESDSKKKRKICSACYYNLTINYNKLLEKNQKGESLLSEPLPVPRDLVLLEDSEEDSETDPSDDSEFEVGIDEIESSDCGSGVSSDSGDFNQQLDKIMGRAIEKLNFDKQLTLATESLKERLENVTDDFDKTDKMFQVLEKDVDTLRKELYQDFELKIKELPPVDLNKYDNQAPVSSLSSSSLPPAGGQLVRAQLTVGQNVLAMRHTNLQGWKLGVIEEVQNSGDVANRLYKVKFESTQGNKKVIHIKILKINHVAYSYKCKSRFTVGTRCVGLYKESTDPMGSFYSGIIAEPPKTTNRNRYLVFFDDGYASYLHHDEIRLVCHQSANVWEDIHPDSSEFIKMYLEKYPERPMVKLCPGQVVNTEREGQWWRTRVLQVDASLARIKFDADKRIEWIYRGSTRLGPLFTELEQQKQRIIQSKVMDRTGGAYNRRNAIGKRRNAPYIEYRRDGPDAENVSSSDGVGGGVDASNNKKPVARKSTTTTNKPVQAVTKWEYEGQVFQTEIDPPPMMKFVAHNCSVRCLADPRYQYNEKEFFRCVDTDEPNNDKDLKNHNPLLIPIIHGWARQLVKHKLYGKIKKKIVYQAPCGRRLRTLVEIHRYLTITQSKLEIDFFNFDWWLHVYNEFKPSREFCTIKDLSYGKENVAISCVNSIDRNYPEYVEYSTVRLPQKDVHLNLEPEFLTSCDCTDDCRRKDKCACWQLTIQNTRCDRENKVHKDVGYQHRRLNEIVITGIYECNKNCKCSKTCLNRVVQHPLRIKLQVFKTEKRGWGIRTLHDIPQGAFVSVYVGNLYSSEEANIQGQNFGDEYFAELDMIEVIERRKDGYESDVSDEGFNDEEEDVGGVHVGPSAVKHSLADDARDTKYSTEEYSEGSSDDQDFNPNKYKKKKKKKLTSFMQFDGAADDGSEEDTSGVQKPKRGGFAATVGIAGPNSLKMSQAPAAEKFVSARKLFNKDEDVYIMDAKSIGNIGRYLNHSCNPNVFVQNVFVDTHDLRFPWIAFFTSHFIRAGGELCWDYNYEVGSIPGKELYCSCGSEYCRGKLL